MAYEVITSNEANNWMRLRLLATNVPATGYKLIRVVPDEAVRDGNVAGKSRVFATADSLENEFLRLNIDPRTGCITSLYDKRSQTEALASAGAERRLAGGVA